MVLPLLGDDGLNGLDRGLVFPSQLFELMLQMAEDNTLYGHCGCRNGPAAKKSCDQTECEAPDPAEPITPAARSIAALKLGPEYGSVPFFMRLELGQLCNHAGRRDSSEEDLPGIDVDGPVFTRVVDLENARSELTVFAG